MGLSLELPAIVFSKYYAMCDKLGTLSIKTASATYHLVVKVPNIYTT